MGLLRFLLALAVLVTHSDALFNIKFVPGNIAVEAFFIISGFYMSMIITEKYSIVKNGYSLFITNRLIRIYPIYWLILLISVCYSLVLIFYAKRVDTLSLYFDYWHSINPLSWFYVIFTNIIIIGQDVVLFLKVNALGNLQFTSHFMVSNKVRVYSLEFVPQAWSLSLELVFYFLSPFIVKLKNNTLIIIAAAIFSVRIIAWYYGLDYDPWTSRFLPFELLWFLAGILSYRGYKKLLLLPVNRLVCYGIFSFVIGATLFLNAVGSQPLLDLFYLFAVVLAIPFIFLITKSSKFDRWIGEFSYPFYISHILCLKMAQTLIGKFKLSDSVAPVLAFVITFVFCYILIELFGKKIERIRALRVKKSTIAETATLI
jgi:peptidoglycan/LPS O-acetylase OafA/YrhL